MIEIRQVRAGEGLRVKEVRLRALQADPQAFSSTYQEEAALPDSTWEQRAIMVAEGRDAVTFVAEEDGAWLGIVFAYQEKSAPDTVDVAGLWVDPKARRQNAARRLLDAVVTWAQQQKATRARLWLTETQEAARRLYAEFGFMATGAKQSHRIHPAVQLVEMVRALPGGSGVD